MAAPKLKYASGNSASTTLSSSVANTDTAFPLTSDTNFEAKSGEGMVIMDEGQATEELGYATTKSGASLTIPLANRGLEGGTAAAHSSGATVKGILTAGMWNDLVDALVDNLLDQTAGTTKTGIALTSPKVTTGINDSNNNELIKVVATTSAVNEVTVTNAATGNPPILEATGGDTNIHLVARAKGNGLLKTSVLRQDNTTNAYKHNSVILTGWGFITGDGANSRIAEAVTFGITFAAAPVVTISFLGYKANSDPTAIGDFTTTTDNQIAFRALSITTGGFSAEFKGSGNPAASERVGYSWIAIGEL